MFFGGTNGFDAFYPDRIVDNLIPPPIAITDFQLANKSVPIGNNSVLKRSIIETDELELSFLIIEYIYAPNREAPPSRVREIEITSAMLGDHPAELQNELREATLALNREAAFEVIARIGDHTPEVAEGLREMVENLQMGRIQDLFGEPHEQ